VIVPAFALTVLKFLFLALLYFFVYRAVRSVVVDVRGTAARGAVPRSSKAEARPSSPPAERRGKRPRELLLVDERGKKAASFRLEGAMQIGRADACHVKLSDTYVSQFHARVFQLFDEFVQVGEFATDGAVGAEFAAVLDRDGHGDGILVDVQTDIVDDFFHGCLVLLCCC